MAYRSNSPPTLSWLNDDFGNTDSEGASSQDTSDSPNNKTAHVYHETLNDILTTVTNIVGDEQIEEKFGRQIGHGKIKQQFVQKPGSDKALGITLMYYKNESDGDYDDRSTFTKLFIDNNDDLKSAVVLEKILQEVFYQKEFNKVHKECGFKMPEIINYGYVLNSDIPNEFIFYIKMSYVDSISVTNKYEDLVEDVDYNKCNIVQKRLVKIANCLEKNGLYHNDLHSDNVMIDNLGNIVIIDFGEASNSITLLDAVPLNFCHKIKSNSLSGGNRHCITRKKKKHYKKRKSIKKHKRSKKYRASRKPKPKNTKTRSSRRSISSRPRR